MVVDGGYRDDGREMWDEDDAHSDDDNDRSKKPKPKGVKQKVIEVNFFSLLS